MSSYGVRRFSRRKDVERVFRQGRRYGSGWLRVFVRPNDGKAHHVTVVCGKQVTKSAVGRNRMRRIFFEAFRDVALTFSQAVDCAIVIQKGAPPGLDTRQALQILAKTFGS